MLSKGSRYIFLICQVTQTVMTPANEVSVGLPSFLLTICILNKDQNQYINNWNKNNIKIIALLRLWKNKKIGLTGSTKNRWLSF